MTSPARAQARPPATRWGVVVPVKRLEVAKSRLAVLGDPGRRALALAFAEDVVLAAVRSPAVERVLVVTDDAAAGPVLARLGADVVPDLPAAGLNPALEHGAELLRAASCGLGVAAVSADLPALSPGDLTALLTAATGRAVVADAAGTGTTVLAAARGHDLAPAYGEQSLSRHLASGARLLAGPPGARRDVDTPDDLLEALRLGVGPRTAGAAAALGLRTGGAAARPSPAQGTMHP